MLSGRCSFEPAIKGTPIRQAEVVREDLFATSESGPRDSRLSDWRQPADFCH
jgi:hypothetical protein